MNTPTHRGSPSIKELVEAFGPRPGREAEHDPRSLDLPISRACWRGDHLKCRGEWTAYPDHSGPCECPDADCPCSPEPEVNRAETLADAEERDLRQFLADRAEPLTLVELIERYVNAAALCAVNENDLARFVSDKGICEQARAEIERRWQAAVDVPLAELARLPRHHLEILDGRA